MHVLHLITSTRSFFEQQIDVLEDRGVTCTVLDAPGEYRPDAPRTATDYLRYYPRMLSAVREYDVDLVHAHYGLVAPLALAQPIRPVVLSLWGTDLMGDRRWLQGFSRFGARGADATILPSSAMADAIGTDYHLIPFGVDLELFKPMDRDVARERLGWSTDRPVALFPYDPDRPEKRYKLAERVVSEAAVDVDLRTIVSAPYEDVPLYMNASDLLLVTSSRESGPMTVKEAAACNLPVVATDVGFVRETIADVRNCAVAADRSALVRGIERVIRDGGRSNGRMTVEGLGLDAMGDRLHRLYTSMVERSTPPEPAVRERSTSHGS